MKLLKEKKKAPSIDPWDETLAGFGEKVWRERTEKKTTNSNLWQR